MSTVTIDEAIQSANGLGKFQILTYIYCAFLTQLPGGMLSVVPVFIAQSPEWECDDGVTVPSNYTDVSPEECTFESEICSIDRSRWHYTRPEETISAEWSLICADEWKGGTIASAWFIGYLAGVGIFGAMSDSRGRRMSLVISTLLASVFGLLSALAPSLEWMAVFRAIAGAGCGGNTLAGFLLATEVMSAEWSGLMGIFFSSFFAIALVILAVVGTYEPRWRRLVIISSLSNLVFLPFLGLLPESPRWQLASGDATAAAATIERFARVNGRSITSPLSLATSTGSGSPAASADAEASAAPVGIGALCRSPVLRRRLLAMIYIWFSCSFSYYGLSLNLGNLSGSTASNLAFSGLCELPALLVAAMGARSSGFCGRRSLLLLLLLCAGVACLAGASITVPDDCNGLCDEGQMLRTLALGGRMAVAGAFALLYVYSAELFPTLVRSLAMGLCSQSARMGGIVAPVAVLSASVSPALPLTLFGVAGMASVGATLLLPETMGVVLPDSIEELEAMESKKSMGGGGGADDEEGIALLEMGRARGGGGG